MTTTMATASLQPRLRTIWSVGTRSRRQFHTWPNCAAAAKFDNVGTSAATSSSVPAASVMRNNSNNTEANIDNLLGGGTAASNNSKSNPPLSKITNDQKRQRGRHVRDVEGVSVIYQQSATAIHRRKMKEDRQQRHATKNVSATVRSNDTLSTGGGSIVATMSATEKHRQTRGRRPTAAVCDQISQQQTVVVGKGSAGGVVYKTNPSALRLPIDEDDDYYDMFDQEAMERVYNSEIASPRAKTTTDKAAQEEGNENESQVTTTTGSTTGRTAITVAVGASSIVFAVVWFAPL